MNNDISSQTVFLVGVAGGTGSGKTTLSKNIQNFLGNDKVAIIDGDAYYKENSHLSFEERQSLNFDHPSIIDTKLLYQHILELKDGKPIKKPVYDFNTHLRKHHYVSISPLPIIIIEGILLFCFENISPLFDLRVFVDEDERIRLRRRIKRDISERSRSENSIMNQYIKTVYPMHKKYVEPSKKNAHIILKPEDTLDKIYKILNKSLN